MSQFRFTVRRCMAWVAFLGFGMGIVTVAEREGRLAGCGTPLVGAVVLLILLAVVWLIARLIASAFAIPPSKDDDRSYLCRDSSSRFGGSWPRWRRGIYADATTSMPLRRPRMRLTPRASMLLVLVAFTSMRRPRMWLTVRGLMLLVLIAGGFLGYQLTQGRWMVRREWATRRIAYHARKEAVFRESTEQAEAYIRFLGEEGFPNWAAWKKAEAKIVGEFGGMLPWWQRGDGPPPSFAFRRSAIKSVREDAVEFGELAGYHERLGRKYLRARDRPWEIITPDPPLPSVRPTALDEIRFRPVRRSSERPPEEEP